MIFERKGAFGILTLNQPEIGNCFWVEEARVIDKALKMPDLEGLLLRNSGRRFFCTGGNLRAQGKLKSRTEGLAAQRKIRKTLDQLYRTAIPTLAMVNGDAFGGGTELLSCCDYVLCTPHCVFGFWQRKISLSYGWGGGERLASRIGRARLARWALEAKSFSAWEAQRIGLVDEVVPEADLEVIAWQWLEHQCRLPKAPVKAIKDKDFSGEGKAFDRLWFNKEHRKILNT